MYAIELFVMPYIKYVCVTQHKDPKEELLSALLGASWWNERQPPTVAWRDRVHGGSGG